MSNYVHLSPTGVVQKQSNDHRSCTFNYKLPAQQYVFAEVEFPRGEEIAHIFHVVYDILQKLTCRSQNQDR